MKKFISYLLIAALMFSMFGCGSQSGTNGNGGNSGGGINGGADSPGAGTETPGGKPAPELAPVPAIVFDDAADDPMNRIVPGMGGVASLKLTLYETSPGVYSGDGVFERTLAVGSSEAERVNSKYNYRLSFEGLKAGASGHCPVVMMNDHDINAAWAGHTESGFYKARVLSTGRAPLEYLFETDGGSAALSLGSGAGATVFNGKLTQAAPAAANPGRADGLCISVNSTFYETGKSYNHESRAMLTATQASGKEFAGNLIVYGEAKDMVYVEEAVKFTLSPFDAKAYRDAGGLLSGSFDAYGLINASAGKYIVLLDGDTPLIEIAGSEMVFWGSLIPAAQAGEAKRIADETRKLMRQLYDNPDKEKYKQGDSTEPWAGKPPWYPRWLLPEPLNASGWAWSKLMNAQGFNWYRLHYSESATANAVFESYSAQLAGREGFEAFSPDSGEVAIYYRQGAYSVMLRFFRHNVIVYIT